MSDNPDSQLAAHGIVARPLFQLRSLPIRFRWEVTRRHPYYQVWWKAALRTI